MPALPLELRHERIRYRSTDGDVGYTAYPIDYDDLYNLKGRLLTLADATFTDPAQRKAHKDVVWHILGAWMQDIERRAEFTERETPNPPSAHHATTHETTHA